MSTTDLQLPTVISSSALLNAIVRGAESAATELGEGYFSVVRKDFTNSLVCVYSFKPQGSADPLDGAQTLVGAEPTVWSLELSEYDLMKDAKGFEGIFPGGKARYFFLTEQEALDYIGAIEKATASLVLKSAADLAEGEN